MPDPSANANHAHRAAPPALRRRCRRMAGFTLTEALLASTVLAFAVAALMQAIVAGQMQTYHALHETRATALNEALLDELLSVPYSELPSWDGFSQSAGEIQDTHGNPHADAYQRFEQNVEVSAEGSITLPGMGTVVGRSITITVSDDREGEWRVQRFVFNPAAAGPGDEMEEIDP
ncbi:hypothetical protein ACERK3_08475 [Phycisphaerales bacterium AB-hyl4]|uniref:Prepilin-type N-terminal cleavage/methylation domain-containing protein n=1 Tax=Natronomicrosphaera hydrolytica TaxID=3242702 RepID=A0ABV4U751_9BACT